MVIGGILVLYCIIGCIVGCIKWAEEEWPVYTIEEDTVGGLAHRKVLCLERTVLFMFFCGPLFWLAVLFFNTFRKICGILKDEETTEDEG